MACLADTKHTDSTQRLTIAGLFLCEDYPDFISHPRYQAHNICDHGLTGFLRQVLMLRYSTARRLRGIKSYMVLPFYTPE